MNRILIIDDDEIIGRMYYKTFTYAGYDVELIHDSVAGLELTRSTNPDLVILDVMMPRMNGLELLEELKGDIKTKDIKVIMLSNLGVQDDISKILDHSGVIFLTKSDTEPSKVLEKVEELLA